jgi:hypothetical protein
MPADFSPTDLAALREHGIVIYAERIIFDAQPPIAPDTLARVQATCSGPIPQQLLDLWSVTAGGSIDYDVSIELDGGKHSFSWTELFYEGATTYFDLPGWIGRELEGLEELCEESGRPFPGVLSWLPIGGFEYLDRAYVCVEPGEEYGSVAFWMQGLPPAWTHRLHVSSMATAAPSLNEAFALLHLEVDPREEFDGYRSGTTLLEYLDTRVSDHGLARELVGRLVDFYARALIDWQAMLDDGSIIGSQSSIGAAFGSAIHNDDPAVVRRLSELGERFDTPFSGAALAVDVALRSGAHRVLGELLRVHAAVPSEVFQGIASELPADLARMLLERGGRATYEAVAQAVACGAPETARVIANALPGIRFRRAANVTKAADELRGALESQLTEVRAGELSHYLGETGLQLRIDRLAEFSL